MLFRPEEEADREVKEEEEVEALRAVAGVAATLGQVFTQKSQRVGKRGISFLSIATIIFVLLMVYFLSK